MRKIMIRMGASKLIGVKMIETTQYALKANVRFDTTNLTRSYTNKAFAYAGRSLSGLLKAATKDGRIKSKDYSNRIVGKSTWYEGEESVFDSIVKEAGLRTEKWIRGE